MALYFPTFSRYPVVGVTESCPVQDGVTKMSVWIETVKKFLKDREQKRPGGLPGLLLFGGSRFF